jgi:hypothetical protein
MYTGSVTLVLVIDDGHLPNGQLRLNVVSHKLDLVLVILQLSSFLARCFRLFLPQSENGIIQDLPKCVVVELTHGKLLVFFLFLQVFEHLLEHALLIARTHTIIKALFLPHLSLLLSCVEFDLIFKILSVCRLTIALLELCLDLLKQR